MVGDLPGLDPASRPAACWQPARALLANKLLRGRRIFGEQFGDDALARYSRRTQRLETIVHHLGLALGGRPAAAFANRLMMPVSKMAIRRKAPGIRSPQSSGEEIDPDVAHKLVLTEEEIARRHPGQLLQPYLDWKRRSDTPR